MATEKISNNGQSTLNGGINNSVTSLTVLSPVFFPTTGNFRIQIDSEIMLVTAVAGSAFTVTRAQEGTSAASHSSGAAVDLVSTAGALKQIWAEQFQHGTDSALPAAERNGRVYYATDTQKLYFDNGTAWTGYSTTGAAANAGPHTQQGRLTLTSGTPVTTSDVTGATSIYFTPYKGNQIALWNGTNWVLDTFTEITIALGTLTSGKPYDLFAYDNSGTVTFDSPVAWTNGTTRATALTTQNGVLVKSGDATRRYIGTFYTTSTTTTEDSILQRFLWNYYNRVPRLLKRSETTQTWTYGTTAWRQANGSSSNQVAGVIGWQEVVVELTANNSALAGSGGGSHSQAVGEDSITVPDGACCHNFANPYTNTIQTATCRFVKQSAVGYHYWAWLEFVNNSGFTFYSNYQQSGVTYGNSGIIGHLPG